MISYGLFVSTLRLWLLITCISALGMVGSASDVYWVGSSGQWSDASKWNTGQVPDALSSVTINISSVDYIKMDISSTILALSMIGGMVELQSNITLNISSSLSFEAGVFSCRNDVLDSEEYSHIHLFGDSAIRGPARKYLRYVNLHQQTGQLKWTDGDLILYNSSIIIQADANFTIISTSMSTSSPMILQADESRTQFDAYPNQVLNTEANLVYLYPPKGGVLDMALHRASRISTTRTSREVFPVLVSQDLPSLQYYAQSVTDVGFGYRYSMYNTTIADVDEDMCAYLCFHSYSWCSSFDFSYHNATCRLSRFSASQVGGLSNHRDRNDEGFRFPVRHFQRRSAERPVDSFVIGKGPIVVSCSSDVSSCLFVSSVVISIADTLHIRDGTNATFENSLFLLPDSTTSIAVEGSLSMSGLNSNMYLYHDALLTRDGDNVYTSSIVAFKDGLHMLNGSMAEGLHVFLSSNAVVEVVGLNTDATRAGTGVYGQLESRLFASTLTIESEAVLRLRCSSGVVNASSVLVTSGKVTGSNITILANSLIVESDGVISTFELGYGIAQGPSAGSAGELGGSGGSYGGRGAPGKVDTSDDVYGSAIYPSDFGSGGGLGYYGDTYGGGAGGGVIVLRSVTASIDGEVSSNGGAGVFGGGGGSGGTIAIYATSLSGQGLISAIGGDGGYSGGLLSGGGGSGGRIALHAESYSFNGSLSNYGGFSHPTYDLPNNEQAGAGTIFLASGNDNVRALVVADQQLGGYVSYFLQQTAMSSILVSSKRSHQELRGSYVLNDTAAWDESWQCSTDLHVVGACPLTLAMPSFCLSRIIGSGEALIHLRNGVNITLANEELYLQGVNLTFYDSVFPASSNITIGNNASLGFQNLDQSFSPENANHGYYRLRRLEIQSGGRVVFRNASRLQVDELILHANSTIELHGDVILELTTVILHGVLLDSPSKLNYALHVASSSVVHWINDDRSDLVLQSASLVVDGLLNITASQAHVSYEASIQDSLIASGMSFSSSPDEFLYVFGRLEVGANGQLHVLSSASVLLDTSLFCRNTSQTNVFGSLSMRYGGYAMSGATISVASNAVISIEWNEFVFGEGVLIPGDGSWVVTNSGILRLPPVLTVYSAPIYIMSSGMLRAIQSTEEGVQGSQSVLASYNISSNIVVEVDGVFEVESNVMLAVSDLDLRGGDLRILGEFSSFISIEGARSVWSSGLIVGQGTVTVATDSLVSLSSSESLSFGKELRIEEAALTIYGSMSLSVIDVYWARGAKIVNFGLLNFTDTVHWVYNRSLLSFQDLEYRLYDVPMEGTALLHNRTKEECARQCLFEDVTLYTGVAMQMHEAATSECVAFVYNEGLQACKFFIDRFATKEKVYNNASWLSWQVYNKVDDWVLPPSFTNDAIGTVTIGGNGNASIGFPVVNEGVLNILGSGSSLVCEGGFLQLASTGQSWIEGQLEIVSANSYSGKSNANVVSGKYAGTGVLYFSGNASSEAATNWTAVDMVDTSLTIDIRARVSVFGGSGFMKVSTFRVQDYGQFILQESPMTLVAWDMVHLATSGILTSVDGTVITSDGYCVSCFDMNITTDQLLVESGGQLNVALGYVTARNITVRATGSIVADGRGFGAQQPILSSTDAHDLTGAYGRLGCSGGGHVGPGGLGEPNSVDIDLFGDHVTHGTVTGGYTWGFAGGQWSASSTVSRGGGAVILVCHSLILGGRISSFGQTTAENDLSGGGGGGSVRIETSTLSGDGFLQVDGGDGGLLTGAESAGWGGGGGGGRLVVYTDNMSEFRGNMTALGGQGYQIGSPGLIYVASYTSGKHGTLMCGSRDGRQSNPNPTASKFATITEPIEFGTIDQVILNTDCNLLLHLNEQEAILGAISGDGTGTLIVSNGTVLTPYTIEDTTSEVYNHTLYVQGATVVVAEAVLLASSVVIKTGGVLALTQSGGSSSANASIYSFYNMTVEGEVRFDYTTTKAQSSAFRAVEVHVQDVLYIDAQGVLSSDAQGRSGSYDISGCSYGSTSGCGEYGAVGGGGGGHGGYGGSGFGGRGGQPHGVAMNPLEFGSGGGGRWPNVAGGAGGGIVYVNATKLVNMGTISADGAEGSGSGSGGGSGGSIYVEAYELSGVGSIHADGGDGLYSNVHFGGAGSGGRVFIACTICQGSDTYNSGDESLILYNVTAKGGSYQAYTDAKEGTYQVPLWDDFGYTLKEWLVTMPSEAGAGTVIWRQQGLHALKVSNAVVKSNTTTTVCQQIITTGPVYDLNCTRFPYELSRGITLWSESGVVFVNIQVDEYAVLRVESDVSIAASTLSMDNVGRIEVYGTWSFDTSVTFSAGTYVLYGSLIGAADVILENGFNFSIAPNASWFQSEDLYQTETRFAYIYNASEITTSVLNTSSIEIRSGAGMTFLGDSDFESMRAILFTTTMSLLGTDTYVTATGFGYTSKGKGSTAIDVYKDATIHNQASGNVSYADGGYHAGRGGGYYYTYPSLGTAMHPVSYGAAGGSTFQANGGNGGGCIHIVVRNSLWLEGSIRADGSSCKESDVRLQSQAGGGAGGSVWIEVTNGSIMGNGTVSATGGDGCNSGGGAGSGGRVALYTADGTLIAFSGSVLVGGGSQAISSTQASTVYLPAGGTVYVSDVGLTNSKLASCNDGRQGSEVMVVSSCIYPTGSSMFHVGQLLAGDVDLHLSSCIFEIDQIASVWSTVSTVASLLSSTPSFARVVASANSTIISTAALDVSDVTFEIADGIVVFAENVTLNDASHLQLSTFGSKLIGVSQDEIASLQIASSPNVDISSFTSIYGNYSQPFGLTYLVAKNIALYNGSRLSFAETDGRGWEASNVIQATSLYLSQNATISASAVVKNKDLAWDAIQEYSYFGASSEASPKGASGGGHAGEGLLGTQGMSAGSSRGNLIFPYGPGGAGGNDRTKKAYGGGGGGGLRFLVSEYIELNGRIDVSGGSAELDTAAGGGAGGSIYMDSPTAVLWGTGRLYANGGDGGVSATTTQHGGSGSGGVIAFRVCVDLFEGLVEAKGGLTVKMPSWLPAKLTTADYKRALAMKGLVTTTGNYRRIQEVHTAANGVFTRFANQSSLLGIDTDTLLTKEECQRNEYWWRSSTYPLVYLGLHGHTSQSLQESSPSINADLLDNIVSSMQLSSISDISEVVDHGATLSLPVGDFNITHLKAQVFSMTGSSLTIRGSGGFTASEISGDTYSTLTIGGQVDVVPEPDLRFANMTWNLTENSCVAPNGQTLEIKDGGRLLVFNVDLDDPSIAYPSDIAAFLTGNCTISFFDMILSNDARLAGSKLSLSAETVTLQRNSSITATACGPYGGAGGKYATSGYGYGSGIVGDVGGDGGGFGGRGAQGLMTLYRQITEDSNLGDSGFVVSLNDSSLSGLGNRNSTKYGSYLQPVQMGSGGGGDQQHFGRGGRGGGAVVLHLHGDIYMDSGSFISADGESIYEGGGGGSGGSVWIRHVDGNRVLTAHPTVVFNGDIIGSGRISADGGKTCPQSGCMISPDYPGGFGAGGRIRIEKVMELYSGSLSARSGASNNSISQLEMDKMGSVVRIRAISTLILNQTSDGVPVLEIVFTQNPKFVVQTISSRGQGAGDRNAANASDAIVRGYWTLGYQSSYGHDVYLSAQASAADVQAALLGLNHPDISKVSVARTPSDQNGWEWRVTFHNYPDRITPIIVDNSHLYCTSGQPSLSVEVLRPYNQSYNAEYLGDNDAPAVYDATELGSMVSFNEVLLSQQSYAYWRNYRTLRIVPGNSISYEYLKSKEESLIMESIFLVPTFEGFVYSLSPPYLKEFYDPNWKFPTSVPSNQPTMQPSSQPSVQPSTQPSGQPSIQPSMQPSFQPTTQPSGQPSSQPSMQPSNQPSGVPTMQPSSQPSSSPTMQPSSVPTMQPSSQPSGVPTMQPSSQPSSSPTTQPSSQPTMQPSSQPSSSPTMQPSSQPTMQPSSQPSSKPTMQPSSQPSSSPTMQPSSQPTMQPSSQPSSSPTRQPSSQPTMQPSRQPSSRPTGQPSRQPTMQPSRQPTSKPSMQPSRQPTMQPSRQPTSQPTMQPSRQPTSKPTMQPSRQPTMQPSRQPFSRPTGQPSRQPSSKPSRQPTSQPTSGPSCQPSSQPTNPTGQPSSQPTNPTGQPSSQPSMQPSWQPSAQPSMVPSAQPSMQPTTLPSVQPSAQPSSSPTDQPTKQPSSQPSSHPSSQPSEKPSHQPTSQPSTHPSCQPSRQPSSHPSHQPTARPTKCPTGQPSAVPSCQPLSHPSTQPSCQPTSSPTLPPSSNPSISPSQQPTSRPSAQPTNQPSTCPSSQPSSLPSLSPSCQPSAEPSADPTTLPSSQPSVGPSSQPSASPSFPSSQPTCSPSSQPSVSPTTRPSDQPFSSIPTSQPSSQPFGLPSSVPSSQPTCFPSAQPSLSPTFSPSTRPSVQPSSQPFSSPSSTPSKQPISSPTSTPSGQPSSSPTDNPSVKPSQQPTIQPSSSPTNTPSELPSTRPSNQPSVSPSRQPTTQPSSSPSIQPNEEPSSKPSSQPSNSPTAQPKSLPSSEPSRQPSSQPSSTPSVTPTSQPSLSPTSQPSVSPSDQPSSTPTLQPNCQPSSKPSQQPSIQPSSSPSVSPSKEPSSSPSMQPTISPTSQPSNSPTIQPSESPSSQPSDSPTNQPSESPSSQPSDSPTSQPSDSPTTAPSSQPSSQPSLSPTNDPSKKPIP